MINEIKNRQTEEIVLALCGSVGSGTSTIANKIGEIFSDYDYRVQKIKISDLISKHYEKVKDKLKKDKFLNEEYVSKINLNQNIQELDKADRIALLQSAGNALRKEISKDVLAQLAINS